MIFFQGSRKGNAVLDTLVIVVFLFAMAFGGVISYSTFDPLNSEIQNDTTSNNYTKNASGQLFTKFPTLYDNLFLMAYGLLIIGVIVSVFYLDTHPIFFAISVILLIVTFSVTALLANAYDDYITADASLAIYASSFPFMTWIMTHLLELSIAIGFIILIGLYVKLKGG